MTVITGILLIRHAQPAGWARGRCYGTLEVPLSAEGRAQSFRLAQHLRTQPLARIYASPRLRALVTARAVAQPHGCDPVVRDDIAEIDFGAFEGRTFDEIAHSHPEVYERWMQDPTSVRFPGGESFDDLRARVTSWVASARKEHEGERVVAVTHGGVIRAVLADAIGVVGRAIFSLDQSHGGMSLIEWIDDQPMIRFMNVVV